MTESRPHAAGIFVTKICEIKGILLISRALKI